MSTPAGAADDPTFKTVVTDTGHAAALTAAAPDDAWFGSGDGTQVTLHHYTAGTTNTVTLDSSLTSFTLDSSAPDDVWLAGRDQIWHYDGASWARIDTPVTGRFMVKDVAGSAAFVGVNDTVYRVDGRRWAPIATVGPTDGQSSTIERISATATGQAVFTATRPAGTGQRLMSLYRATAGSSAPTKIGEFAANQSSIGSVVLDARTSPGQAIVRSTGATGYSVTQSWTWAPLTRRGTIGSKYTLLADALDDGRVVLGLNFPGVPSPFQVASRVDQKPSQATDDLGPDVKWVEALDAAPQSTVVWSLVEVHSRVVAVRGDLGPASSS